jgi:hypothetical protein
MISESIQPYGDASAVDSQHVQEIVTSFYVSTHAQCHAGNVDVPKGAEGLIRDESAHLRRVQTLRLNRGGSGSRSKFADGITNISFFDFFLFLFFLKIPSTMGGKPYDRLPSKGHVSSRRTGYRSINEHVSKKL